MSTLDKLQIKGVRSFGTQANDEQVFEYNPTFRTSKKPLIF